MSLVGKFIYSLINGKIIYVSNNYFKVYLCLIFYQ